MSNDRTAVLHAAACGAHRGRVEFMNSMRAGQDITYYVIVSLILLVVLFLNRNTMVEGTDVSVATFMLPGLLALQVVFAGAYGIATVLVTEREDGTLLRLKSVPYGLVGYVAGQLVRVCLEIAFSLVIVLIPAAFFVPNLMADGFLAALGAVGYLVLGLLAVVPLGFIVGSVFKNPRSVGGWGLLVMGAIVWVSGIFTPLATMVWWAQALGQLTPTYWLGLGLRSTLLPESAMVVEIDGSWRTLLTIVVLAVWAIAGMLLAPILLRRMARRESGSSVAARREKALQRV
ncbi:ABC transporter permease [Nakamurella sp. GG22]